VLPWQQKLQSNQKRRGVCGDSSLFGGVKPDFGTPMMRPSRALPAAAGACHSEPDRVIERTIASPIA
jgi:hypothetical protein